MDFFNSMGAPKAEDTVAAAVRSTSSPPLEPILSSKISPLFFNPSFLRPPSQSVTPDSVDALLSRELNRLSFKEREGISEEIHGVHCIAVEETSEFVHRKLQELEYELQNISDFEKAAYLEAKRLQSVYLDDVAQLRLPILRAEVFDTRKAAVRLVKFLDLVYDLCGIDALMRPMNLSDFNAEDLELMKQGLFQMINGRDRSGRRIMGNFADIPSHFSVRSRIKNALYMYMCLAEDIETQQKGGVFIVFHPSPGTQVCASAEEREFVQRLMASIPVRVSGIHVCLHDDAVSKLIRAAFLLAIGSDGRSRTRIHIGSKTECQYALQSFGVPSQQIPVNTNSGKLKVKTHQKWIELRLTKEQAIQQGAKFEGIECPELKDLLFGRGRPIMRHPGNVVFRNLLETNYKDYDAAITRKEKTEIAWSIVRQLQESSCRFLKEDPNGYWVEVNSDVARQKVSVGFRDLRKTIEEDGDRIGSIVGAKRDLNSGTSAFLGMNGQVKRQKCNIVCQ